MEYPAAHGCSFREGTKAVGWILPSQCEAGAVSCPSLWFLAGPFPGSALYSGSRDLLGPRPHAWVTTEATTPAPNFFSLFMIIFSLPLPSPAPQYFQTLFQTGIWARPSVPPPEDSEGGVLPSCSLGSPAWLQPGQEKPRRNPHLWRL